MANAVLLLPVMRLNESECRPFFAKIYDRIAEEKSGKKDEAEKSAWILRRIENMLRNLQIPEGVKGFGVTENELEKLTEAGMGVTRLLSNNRREVTREEARKLYLEVVTR